ncbi:lipid A-modifier LpxR family protein [Tabrizicola sp.]|uniref:lipid A-modifier LpxR family protein n=1 Tax=Tabrizicola sp. TaxID=2005166 RepID=UPI003D26CE26
MVKAGVKAALVALSLGLCGGGAGAETPAANGANPANLGLAEGGLAKARGQAWLSQERVTLGWGRIFSNDQLGDGEDRWRSGSYTVSRLRGPFWQGHGAAQFGDVIEFRGHAAVLAPANLRVPAANDRRYAGLLSLGLATHFGWRGAELALGSELALTGPKTGVGGFQKWFHNLANIQPPSAAVLNAQIGNRLHPGVQGEIGRAWTFGGVTARPFAEARLGVESLVRLGADMTIGQFGQAGLMLRDVTTGQRFRGIEGNRSEGLSLTLGGDLAHVFDSALLPSGGAATREEARYRLRAGLHWQGKRAAAFYGVSYLSPEFAEQPEGQWVGALSLNLRF